MNENKDEMHLNSGLSATHQVKAVTSSPDVQGRVWKQKEKERQIKDVVKQQKLPQNCMKLVDGQ